MGTTLFSTAWSMPSRWTFEMAPVRGFLERWLNGCETIIDPFSGRSTIGTVRNDLANGGIDAGEWCDGLLEDFQEQADAVLFDPPYSPRQIAECYRGVGLVPGKADTQNAALYRRVRESLSELLKPGGVALSFGWQSSGFGKDWPTQEILLVRHGGAHNDTICVAQRKPECG